MNNFTFYSPTCFVFGKDSETQAGAMVKRFGGSRVLIHYGGGSAIRSGLISGRRGGDFLLPERFCPERFCPETFCRETEESESLMDDVSFSKAPEGEAPGLEICRFWQ
jgi:hypothetical protein